MHRSENKPRMLPICQRNHTIENCGGRVVIVAGLELDFRGRVFGAMGQLMAQADRVEKLTAVCAVCGSTKANRTQRLINGKPASYNDPVVLVGAAEAYEARCRRHHEVPGRDKFSDLF